MKQINKQTGMKWCLALCLSLASVCGQSLMAEGVPGAMKYQAVLRDMEGKPMTNQENLALRITLRQGSPDGTILYQETHNDLSTDAFGLVQLEIGRGEVAKVGSANLLEVPWDNSPIYAQVEVQNDANGFTTMGVSELLSVPYALYSVNSGGGLDLTDRYLPRFDGVRNKLVDSKIKETPMEAIQFNSGAQSYTFPKTRGKEGESLVLTDGDGTLDWRAGGGGGAKCESCTDDYLVYWDGVDFVFRTSKMRYVDKENTVYAKSKFVAEEPMEVKNGLVINTQVTGNHNLQYSELPEHHVWVGNEQQRTLPYKLGTGITLDSTSDPNVRTLNVNSGVSVWEYRPEGNIDYIHTKVDPSRQVKVGVGLSEPKTRFQMQDGSFLLSSAFGQTDVVSDLDKGYHFYWSGEKGALRMGKFDQDASGLWRSANLGAGTIALGTDAEATQDDNVAIGAGAQATGIRSLAMGRNVQANAAKNSVAVGNNVLVSGLNAIGIGNGSFEGNLSSSEFTASGANSVTIGNDIKNVKGDGAVTIGLSNVVSANKSVVIGNKLTVPGNDEGTNGTTNVVLGENITVGSWNYMVQIGRNLTATNLTSGGAISIGADIILQQGAYSVNLGNDLRTQNSNKLKTGCVNIGHGNRITTSVNDFDDKAPVLVGQKLTNHNVDGGVVVGRLNAAATKVSGVSPAFVVGVGTKEADRKNALELYENGNLWVPGVIASNGTTFTSDRRLKTDIQALNADFSVLKSLSPVRYRFIADQNQTLQFGFIAQDVERYFPHLVDTDAQGMKSLNYIGLLPVLWQYTQQLEKTVSDQAAEIERLRAETEALKADMKAIKAKLGL